MGCTAGGLEAAVEAAPDGATVLVLPRLALPFARSLWKAGKRGQLEHLLSSQRKAWHPLRLLEVRPTRAPSGRFESAARYFSARR